MFSKKLLLIFAITCLLIINIIILSVNSRSKHGSNAIVRLAVAMVAPFQDLVTHSIRFFQSTWRQYFYLVSVSKENEQLKTRLSLAFENNNQCVEVELANDRLRKFLNFKESFEGKVLPAEVIGEDISPWFKTIIIDKGSNQKIKKGMPVVVPEGIVGQIIEVSSNYSKVVLIIDRNSAVDALVQRTRARGIIAGDSKGSYDFKYVLRKHDIIKGDTVISSGLDGVFPKGLLLGYVTQVAKDSSGMFQEIEVLPYINYEQLEEVFVILESKKYNLESKTSK